MAVKQEYIDLLVSIQGYSVVFAGTMEQEEGQQELMIQLKRKETRYFCGCGREFTSYYDGVDRCVRDLSYGPYKRSWLMFWQVRLDCPECGVVTEHLDWVSPRVVYTKRLAAAVALSCREIRSIKSVAEQYGLHRGTVKEMDKAALERELPDPSESNPVLLGVDEFSIRRRHRYATVVVDLEGPTVPYVAEDRTKESLSGYYEAIGKDKCDQIEAVAMDMWPAYEEATRDHCAGAEIVYDPFHIIAAYAREVIDKVRSQEARKAAKGNREIIKGSRYLLLKNSENLDPLHDEPARLSELLKLNKRLYTVYTLKDDLKELWRYRSEAWALKWFESWRKRAMRSRIEALKKFASKLIRHIDGILAHCRYPIHTGFLEGVNNKIKVIKRVAFGFRDMHYFFLKIRGAFRNHANHT
jgi:transposase